MKKISVFQRFLSIWVLLCMGVGVLIGHYLPDVSSFLSKLQVANVNIPIAVLIWLMIYPMMLKINFASIKKVGKEPKGLVLTWVINWLVKPFTMFGLALLFMRVVFKNVVPTDLAGDYIAGMVLLGVAPCTAMVFVWSSLTEGNPAYTLVQVATNDLIILVAYVPITALLLGIGGFSIPWDTLLLSILLFIVVPLLFGILTRVVITKRKGVGYLEEKVIPKFNPITTIGLLLMLVLLFTMQADLIIENPVHILLIAIPLVIQTFMIFGITFGIGRLIKLPYDIATPSSFIGASNFFELAIAVAVSVFPLNPGVALATTVGVLVEVPTMLVLVRICRAVSKRYRLSDLKKG